MGGFARPVIALNHDAAIVFKAREDGHGRLRVKPIALIKLWHIFGTGFKAMHGHIGIKAEDLLNIDLFSRGQAGQLVGIAHYGHGKVFSVGVSLGGFNTIPARAKRQRMEKASHPAKRERDLR